jgi:hypothetical protein
MIVEYVTWEMHSHSPIVLNYLKYKIHSTSGIGHEMHALCFSTTLVGKIFFFDKYLTR